MGKGFLLSLEALFVLFLLPYLFFFVMSSSNKNTLKAVDARENFELANDILQVWTAQRKLRNFETNPGVFDKDIEYAGKESGKCIFLPRNESKNCENVMCPGREYYTKEGIKEVRLCAGSWPS